MDHRRRVPEDLMETILGAGREISEQERTPSGTRGAVRDTRPRALADQDAISWDENPERVGVTFNLSKQVNTELERIRLELDGDVHASKSEIVEVALRIAAENVWRHGRKSELIKRLAERQAAADSAGVDMPRTIRSVDDGGFVIDTTYGENGEIMDEDVVANVADLPVEDEYVDEQGRLVSLVKDESGNTFEQIMDDKLNVLETRLLPTEN